MNKNIRQILIALLLSFSFVTSYSVAALAADLCLWAAGSDSAKNSTVQDVTELPVDAVKWWYNSADARYYLFMPTTSDLSNLKIWHNGSGSVTVNGATLSNGKHTNVFPAEGNYSLSYGGRVYPLTVKKSANINSLFMSTMSGSLNKINASADHSFGETGKILILDEAGQTAYDGKLAQVKGRGNSTWKYLKKPYQIKLDSATDLFGMGEHKTWVLLANYVDKTLMSNGMIFEMAENLGLEYSPQYVYADIYANHEYLGTYQLSEKNQAGANRVEIEDLEKATEKLNSQDLDLYSRGGNITGSTFGSEKWYNIPNNPADITGGYLLEFDYPLRYAEEPCGFVTNRGQCVVIKAPEFASKAQVEYISGFVQDVEDAIYSEEGYNSKGKHYSEYMDVDSAILRYLIEEWSLNHDGGYSSFYLYKDVDSSENGLLHFGPVWDYDTACGNIVARNKDEVQKLTNSWLIKSRKIFDTSYFSWYNQLFYHYDFAKNVQKIYDTHFKDAVSRFSSDIDKKVALLQKSSQMNFIRYPDVRWSDNGLIGNGSVSFNDSIVNLKNFVSVRTNFLDKGFGFHWKNNFTDVKSGAWYYNSVGEMQRLGLMVGTSSTTFAPETSISRAMAVSIIARMSGLGLDFAATSEFTDVKEGLWYTAAIAWAAENGIVAGKGNQQFCPEDNVTREELARMLYTYAAFLDEDEDEDVSADVLASFSDRGQVSPWAEDAVAWCVSKELILGVGSGRLAPREISTRGQGAVLFFKANSLFNLQ